MGIFIRRVIPIFFVLSLTATACYRSESQEFEISIPEQAQTSVVVSADGTYITSLVAPENRSIIREIEEIPEMVRNAVIAIEDERFYSHPGIDLKATIRAIVFLNTRGGASTISQQLAR